MCTQKMKTEMHKWALKMKTESLVIFSDTIKYKKKKSEEAAVFKREKYQREIQPVCVSQVSGNNRRQ